VRLLYIVITCIVITSSHVTAAEQTERKTGNKKLEAPLYLSADYIEHRKKEKRSFAKGNVLIEYRDQTLSGDECTINNNTGKGLMDGNVKLYTPTHRIKARQFDFFLATGMGMMVDAEGYTQDGYVFTGRKAVRIEEDRYILRDSMFTTCDPEDPDWKITAKNSTLYVEDVATFDGMTLYFMDLPVFYSPFFVAPTVSRRTTGLLIPQFGWNNTDGDYLMNQYFIALSGQDDITLFLDLYDYRGLREGIEYRYAFTDETAGKIEAFTINDKLTGERLWRYELIHRHELENGIRNSAKIEQESETSYSREIADDIDLYGKRYFDSYVELAYSTPHASTSLYARTYKEAGKADTTSWQHFRKLPELTANLYPLQLFGTPVVGEVRNTVTSVENETLGESPVPISKITRIDTRPLLSLPLVPANGLNLRPWVEGRGAWYSRNYSEETPLTLTYYTAGADIGLPKFYRIFYPENGSIKHTVSPTLTWNLMPDYETDEDRLNVPLIDHLEASSPVNSLTFILANSVVTQSSNNSLGREFIKLSISQGYDFREAARELTGPEDESRPLSPLILDLDSRPTPNTLLNMMIKYDNYTKTPKSVFSEAGVAFNNGLYISYEKNHQIKPESIFSSGIIGYQVSKGLSAEISTIYNELEYENPYSMLRLNYTSCCWSALLAVKQMYREREREDKSIERYIDNSFYLIFSLKGIGDLGGTIDPVFGRKI
jgi:LPS-assembly protein